MIAECQRAKAEPQRQRDTALAANTLTDALRRFVMGDPAYRCFGST